MSSQDRFSGGGWRCPACGVTTPTKHAECPKCGVIVEKLFHKDLRAGLDDEALISKFGISKDELHEWKTRAALKGVVLISEATGRAQSAQRSLVDAPASPPSRFPDPDSRKVLEQRSAYSPAWCIDAWKKYAVFSGRARRREFWLFHLYNLLFGLFLVLIEVVVGLPRGITGHGPLIAIFQVTLLIPNLAVSVRRLHDTNRSGWWLLINLIPIIGSITLFVFLVQNSQQGSNEYGPNPKTGMH